jgi:hypothetical protein
VQGEARPWAVVAVGFALLWLVTLAWGLGRRPAAGQAPAADAPARPVPRSTAGLRRALEGGDLGEVLDALRALAPVHGVQDDWHAWLADPAQRAAVDAIEQARWGQGDPAAARSMARAAFARGPAWRDTGPGGPDAGPLPPLYPG